MHLKTVFIRFYKSFNDDFLRKNDGRVKPKPWEKIDGAFYPYIEVPIENKITTIVGANESGKSHLLSAIEKAITGEGIKRSDFCRYSPFFTVKQNELKYPDFGTEWSGFSDSEKVSLRKIVDIPENIIFDRLFVFRQNIGKYAELRASQEETFEEYRLEESLEESSKGTQIDEPAVEGKVQTVDEHPPVETAETTDNSAKDNTRKKPNLRK
jgi:AAA15 family ATPase/GTPase